MRITSVKILAAVPAAVVLGSFLSSQMLGIGPGSVIATAMPACGGCHFAGQPSLPSLPGGNNLQISCVPTARSLTSGQSISFTTSATGGDPDPKQWGGFCGWADRGTFIPGTRSRNFTLNASDITHNTSNTAGAGRTWTYGYKAPTNYVGLVNVYMAVNTVNGDNSELTGDNWGFHGSDSMNQDSTPIRLYVNATGVAPFGSACVGGFGQYPVLGSKTIPSVGNASFAVEGHGCATSAPAALFFGGSGAFAPVDLGFIGVTGCTLLVDPGVSFSAQTLGGIARRAEGSVTFPIGIPSDNALKGQKFDVQLAIIDFASGRNTPVTLTNGLTITVQ